MTLNDLVNGTWTAWQLAEIGLQLLAIAAAFFAGYERGRRVQAEEQYHVHG